MTLQEFKETKFNEFPNYKHLFFIIKYSKASKVFPVYVSREDDTDDLIFKVMGTNIYYTKEEMLDRFIYRECRMYRATVEKIIPEKAFIEEYLES